MTIMCMIIIVLTVIAVTSFEHLFFSVVVCIMCRHPDKHCRPTFPSLCQSLAEEAGSLLQLIEGDDQGHPQASLLGAPLEAGALLYPDLQNTYQNN